MPTNEQPFARTVELSSSIGDTITHGKTEGRNMINTKHLLKVMAAWVTIVYVMCFVGVALIPGVRPWFMQYALHMNIGMGENILTLTTFISGLVICNVVALLAAWLFAFLHNKIKQ